MNTDIPPIYLSTVLLEKNRWRSRVPSFRVSAWSKHIAEAGFDGIELWENHLLLADAIERHAVRAGPAPIQILNTYCGFDDGSADARAASAELAQFLNVSAVKFNFGNDRSQAKKYIENLRAWREKLPEGCRLLCECHPYTILEEVDDAAKILEPLQGEIEIIVHAFGNSDETELRRWFDAFGTAVTHVHAVLKDKTHAAERLELLQQYGFNGTYSIEFCEGVAEPPEDMAELLANAAADLQFLRKEIGKKISKSE